MAIGVDDWEYREIVRKENPIKEKKSIQLSVKLQAYRKAKSELEEALKLAFKKGKIIKYKRKAMKKARLGFVEKIIKPKELFLVISQSLTGNVKTISVNDVIPFREMEE